MHVALTEYGAQWRQLKAESLSHSTCRVVLFVSCLDVDALCSAKIIVKLLQKDLIPHKIIPVVGYESLRQGFLQLDDDIRNVLCIGCGATVDLHDFLDLPQEEMPHVKFHVIDNHRPWNLGNLYGSNAVICYDDGFLIDIDDYREAYAFLAEDAIEEGHDDGKNGPGDVDDASSDNELEHKIPGSDGSTRDEDHDTDVEGEPGQQHINGTETVLDTIKDTVHGATVASQPEVRLLDSDDDKDDDDEIIIQTRRPVSARPEATQLDEKQTEVIDEDGSPVLEESPSKRRRTLRAAYTKKIQDYYSQGSFQTTSDTVLVYTLLTAVGEISSLNLWLTVVGVTALEPQYPEIYSSLYPLLKDEINRLGGAKTGRSSQTVSTETTFAIETDYSFFLLRQWSLYDSIIHSSYLSAKLYLWTEDGRKNLHKMLAKMGISLQEAREQWAYVNPPLKRSLKSKLESVSGMYGIESIVRDGVIRKFGFKGALSAGDCAESIAALLEVGDTTLVLSGLNRNQHSAHGAVKATQTRPFDPQVAARSSTTVEASDAESSGKEFWVKNFWVAWDAAENFDRLVSGMARAKALQQAVVATGTAIFEKSQLKDLHAFRLAVVRDGPDIDVFKNPLTLARLGVWISEGCAEIHAQPMPLVVASFDAGSDKYLVLGMGPRKAREDSAIDTVYNQFGQAFQDTAELINARFSIDAFESAIIEVGRDDLSRFLENLAQEMRRAKRAI